jgi:ABC-type dipeptide/oligopeptide/nickel transport system permease subunit
MSRHPRAAGVRLKIMISLACAFCVFCLIAPKLAPNDPYMVNLKNARAAPSRQYPFGADWMGRCVCSRVMFGAAASVCSALAVAGVTLLIGCAVGMTGGYLGGMADAVMMRVAEVFMAFPGMVLALAVTGILGAGLANAVIALSVAGWAEYARLARNHVLSLRRENFVCAARLNGQGAISILLRHIVPNAIRPVVVTAAQSVRGIILELAGLSFLGLSAQPPTVEWGSMLADGRGLMLQAPWIVFYPGLAILLTSVLFGMLGDSARDALDPYEVKRIFP